VGVSVRTRSLTLAVALSTAAAVMVVWIVGAAAAARWLVVTAEPRDGQRVDAIVVLAGASTYVERTRHAAELFHRGLAPRVLLTHDGARSGWLPPEQRNPYFVEHAAAELRWYGVSGADIVMLPAVVGSTYDEAVVLRAYARRHGLESLLLVTSAYHSRRALRTFRTVFAGSGTTVYMSPAPPGLQAPPPGSWWRRWLGWKLVPGEYLKMGWYRVRHGG
jgi:uncharacterized SAM-binding protein YcdF (DUF218 family)